MLPFQVGDTVLAVLAAEAINDAAIDCLRVVSARPQHSNRVQRRRRPCAARACCEPRPGGNLTGSNGFIDEFGPRSLALLHELVPGAATIGFLENPSNLVFALTTRDVLAAASVMGLKVQILE